VSGPEGGAIELDEAAPLEDPVDDGGGEIGVVEDPSPGAERLVGGEDHRALAQVAIVDDVEEHVGCVVAVAEVAHFVELCGAPHNSTNGESAVMRSGGS